MDGHLIVWDLSNGGIVAFTAVSDPIDTIVMGGFEKGLNFFPPPMRTLTVPLMTTTDVKRRPTRNYTFATGGNKQLSVWTLDPYQGEFKSAKVTLTGLQRDFRCLTFSPDGEFLYAGTDSGDVAVVQVCIFMSCGCGFSSVVIVDERTCVCWHRSCVCKRCQINVGYALWWYLYWRW